MPFYPPSCSIHLLHRTKFGLHRASLIRKRRVRTKRCADKVHPTCSSARAASAAECGRPSNGDAPLTGEDRRDRELFPCSLILEGCHRNRLQARKISRRRFGRPASSDESQNGRDTYSLQPTTTSIPPFFTHFLAERRQHPNSWSCLCGKKRLVDTLLKDNLLPLFSPEPTPPFCSPNTSFLPALPPTPSCRTNAH